MSKSIDINNTPIAMETFMFLNSQLKSNHFAKVGHEVKSMLIKSFRIHISEYVLPTPDRIIYSSNIEYIRVYPRVAHFKSSKEFNQYYNRFNNEILSSLQGVRIGFDQPHPIATYKDSLNDNAYLQVKSLVTLNKKTKDLCRWLRLKPRGFEWSLLLTSVNNKTVRGGLTEKDMFRAAGNMLNDVCEIVPVIKSAGLMCVHRAERIKSKKK